MKMASIELRRLALSYSAQGRSDLAKKYILQARKLERAEFSR